MGGGGGGGACDDIEKEESAAEKEEICQIKGEFYRNSQTLSTYQRTRLPFT